MCPPSLALSFGQQRAGPEKRDRGCCDYACGGSNTGTYLWTGAGRQKLVVYGAIVARDTANTTAPVGERDHNRIPKEGDYCCVGRGRGGSALTNVKRGSALNFCGPIPVVGVRQRPHPPGAWLCLLAISGDAQTKETGAAVTGPMATVTQTPTRGLMLMRRDLQCGQIPIGGNWQCMEQL